MFRRMDINADQQVTREEYVGLFADSFTHHDTDGDGMLSVEEFGFSAAFKRGDADQDGKLTFAEFTNIYSNQFDSLDKDSSGKVTIDEM